MPRDPISTLADAFGDDEEYQQGIKELVLQTMKMAVYTLKHGSPDAKSQVMRAMLPSVARTIRSTQESDEMDQMREELKAMLREISGQDPEDRDE